LPTPPLPNDPEEQHYFARGFLYVYGEGSDYFFMASSIYIWAPKLLTNRQSHD
jgi:hypothetical protein